MAKPDNLAPDSLDQEALPPCGTCREPAHECAPADDGEPEFKITVRKVQTKVQCRGVLAE